MADLVTLGLALTLKDMVSAPLQGILGKMDKMKRISTNFVAVGAASKIAGGVMMNAMAGPISAFVEAEDAAARLKSAMMLADGSIAPEFEKINDLAVKLGNKLPGNTADFNNMMTTLAQQGVSYQGILGGIGESAALLAVALKLPFDNAARFAAKLGEATGTAEKDMLALMDTIQRTANLGVAVDQMGFAFGRSAGKMKEVKFQGLEASKELSVLFAQMIKTGLSGETVGTGMAAVLTGLQDLEFGLTKKAVEAKGEMAALGIQMDFFSKQGEFKGVENLIGNLEQLKDLSAESRAGILKDLFGSGQDAQIVATLIDKGVAGYKETLERMQKQADLQAKVNEQLKTLAALWEAASGTFENAQAAFAEALAPELKFLTNKFGEFSQGIQNFLKEHPKLAKMAAGFLAFGGAALTAGGTLALALGVGMKGIGPMADGLGILGKAFTSPLRAGRSLVSKIPQWNVSIKTLSKELWATATGGIKALPGKFHDMAFAMGRATGAGWRWVRVNVFTMAGLRGLAKTGWSKIAGGLWSVTRALAGMAVAALANPVVWIVLAIAGAALLLFKFWKPIKGFFKGVWEGITDGIAKLEDQYPGISKGFKSVVSVVVDGLDKITSWIDKAIGWFERLIKPVEDTGGAGQSMGKRFGLSLIGIFPKILKFVLWLRNMKNDFKKAGGELIDGLWAGIQERWAKFKAGFWKLNNELVSGVKGLFGISSPSKVFAGIGKLLTAGLEGGMLAGTSRIKQAANALASAAFPNLRAPNLPGITAPNVIPFPGARSPGVAGGGPSIQPARRPGTGGGMVINFNPTINVNGAGDPEKTGDSVRNALELTMRDFKRVQGQVMHGSARTAYR